jgi:hypothetical protein
VQIVNCTNVHPGGGHSPITKLMTYVYHYTFPLPDCEF